MLGVPSSYMEVGADGSGSPICIDLATRNVVLLDHDAGMARYLINTTLQTFAECLCVFAEHIALKSMDGCVEDMCAVDNAISNPEGWWRTELQNW